MKDKIEKPANVGKMKNPASTSKILFFILLLAMSMIVVSNNTEAWFPEDHVYFTLSQMRSIDSGITRLCRDREAQIMFGNAGADVPVIHYLENKLESYKGTHSRGVYAKCLELPGSDPDLKCVCYGMATHIIQDRTAHYGYVPTYVSKYYGANVILHPLIEKAATMQLLNRLEENPNNVITVEEIEEIAQNTLDLHHEQKYIDLFEKSTGLEMAQDFAAVEISLKGESSGWYEAVYGKKVSYPTFYWMIVVSFFALSIGWIALVFFVGKNNWKYLGYALGIIGLIISFVVLLSLLLGTSWVWFEFISQAPAALLSIDDTSTYVDQVLEDTSRFFQTEQLLSDGQLVDDASGLDHLDINGQLVKGPLQIAEQRFTYIMIPLIAIVVIGLFGLLLYAMSKE